VNAGYHLEGLAVSKDIKMRISVAVIIELLKQKIITKKKVVAYINKLIKIREWEGGALEMLAKRYMQ